MKKIGIILGSEPGAGVFQYLLSQADIRWRVSHGDVDGAERVLREISAASREELAAKGERARRLLDAIGSRETSCGRVCNVLESGLEFQAKTPTN